MSDPILASLTKRRAELAALARETDTTLKRIMADIEHLDGAIRVYQPTYYGRSVMRRPERMGTLRVALGALREATAPLSLRDIALHVIAFNGRNPDEERLVKTTVERVRIALLRQQKAGVVRSTVGEHGRLLWEVAR